MNAVMNIHRAVRYRGEAAVRWRVGRVIVSLLYVVAGLLCGDFSALAQNVPGASSGRSLAGGVSQQFRFGGGTLYIDNQGTQGFLYTPGQNFESYNFRNPTTGQAWSGAVMTFGPQLSIGLIQGGNQVGTPTVLPAPPRQTAPLPPIESGLLDEIP